MIQVDLTAIGQTGEQLVQNFLHQRLQLRHDSLGESGDHRLANRFVQFAVARGQRWNIAVPGFAVQRAFSVSKQMAHIVIAGDHPDSAAGVVVDRILLAQDGIAVVNVVVIVD